MHSTCRVSWGGSGTRRNAGQGDDLRSAELVGVAAIAAAACAAPVRARGAVCRRPNVWCVAAVAVCMHECPKSKKYYLGSFIQKVVIAIDYELLLTRNGKLGQKIIEVVTGL